jgi:hypothetical protein
MPRQIIATYAGQPITFNEAGWFSATAAAARFGKEPYNWLRQRETVEYLAALVRHAGQPNSEILEELNRIKALDGASAISQRRLLQLAKQTGFVQARRGAPETGGGTWMHPKLGVPFARWLDVDFAIWCDAQIETILHGDPARHDWEAARHKAALAFRLMADVLTATLHADGEEAKPYRFTNEARLIGYALTGRHQAPDRDALSADDLALLAQLECRNAVMIASRTPWARRKDLLADLAADQRGRCLAPAGLNPH